MNVTAATCLRSEYQLLINSKNIIKIQKMKNFERVGSEITRKKTKKRNNSRKCSETTTRKI